MKNFMGQVRPSDPLLTTRWLDVACGATWLLYATYGFISLFSPIPTFALAGAPEWYSSIWSVAVTASAMIAFTAVVMFFYDGGLKQIVKKRIESNAVLIVLGLMLVYEILLLVVVLHGDTSRLAQMINVLILFPLPMFRIGHLNRRIRLLRAGGH